MPTSQYILFEASVWYPASATTMRMQVGWWKTKTPKWYAETSTQQKTPYRPTPMKVLHNAQVGKVRSSSVTQDYLSIGCHLVFWVWCIIAFLFKTTGTVSCKSREEVTPGLEQLLIQVQENITHALDHMISFDGQCYEVQKETSEYEFCSHGFLHVSVGYKENTILSANTGTALYPGWKYISMIHERNLPVVPFRNKPCRCDMLDNHLKVIVWDTEAETKWIIFSRRHFQMHLVRWKWMYFNSNFTEFVPKGSFSAITADMWWMLILPD